MEKDNFVKCRDGKDREVFPALIKHRNKIRHYITKFRGDMAVLNVLSPDLNNITDVDTINPENNGANDFSDEPYNAMMEMLVLAFGEQYTPEQIEEFVDFSMIPNILDIFFGISGYKKKVAEASKKK